MGLFKKKKPEEEATTGGTMDIENNTEIPKPQEVPEEKVKTITPTPSNKVGPEPTAPEPEDAERRNMYVPGDFMGIVPGRYEAEHCNLLVVLIQRLDSVNESLEQMEDRLNELVEAAKNG